MYNTTTKTKVGSVFDSFIDQSLSNSVNELLNTFFNDRFFVGKEQSYPYDVYSTKDETVIEIPLAGRKKSDISVSVENKYLKVEVEPFQKSKDGTTYHKTGISSKKFSSVWDVEAYDVENIKPSTFENGLLKITLPFKKKQEPVKTVVPIE